MFDGVIVTPVCVKTKVENYQCEACLEMGLSGNQSPVRLGTEIVDFRGRDGRNLAPNRSKQVRRFATGRTVAIPIQKSHKTLHFYTCIYILLANF